MVSNLRPSHREDPRAHYRKSPSEWLEFEFHTSEDVVEAVSLAVRHGPPQDSLPRDAQPAPSSGDPKAASPPWPAAHVELQGLPHEVKR